jgi:MFS family permease
LNIEEKQPPLSHRETLVIVFGVLLPLFLGSLSQSIAASALPTIGRALGATGDLSWVITAYLLTQTAATPLFGKFSDTYGRRTTMQVALWIFIVGSVACALAPNITMLVAARAVQGVAAGGLTSIPMTVLGDLAPPKYRARYYTYFSLVYITAGALGPALGGFFAEYVHWSALFWFGVPFAFLAIAVTRKLLLRLPAFHRYHKLDLAGALLIVGASLSFMFVLTAGGKSYEWLSPQIAGLALLSCCLWAGFVWRLQTAAEPLIPLDIIKNRIVAWAIIANGLGWSGVIGLNIYLPVWLQSMSGMTPSQSGLSLMIVMVGLNTGALVGAQLASRVTHYKRIPLVSLVLCICATLYLAWRSAGMGFLELQIVLGIWGFTFGPVPPVTSVSMQNTIPQHRLGTAVGAMAFVRGLISTFIVAIFGLIVLHTLPGADVRDALRGGDMAAAASAFRTLFLVGAGCLAASLVALLFMEEQPLGTKAPGA